MRWRAGPLGRSLVAACRCDAAVVLRDMGRLEDALVAFKEARSDLAADVHNEPEAPDERAIRQELLRAAAVVRL